MVLSGCPSGREREQHFHRHAHLVVRSPWLGDRREGDLCLLRPRRRLHHLDIPARPQVSETYQQARLLRSMGKPLRQRRDSDIERRHQVRINVPDVSISSIPHPLVLEPLELPRWWSSCPSLTRTSSTQVSSSRCVMDLRHGVQRLSFLLPSI